MEKKEYGMMDIGILVTNNLAWSKHIEWMTTKGNRTLGLVRRMCRHNVSLDVKKVLYCTLVRSRLEYACKLWSPYGLYHKGQIGDRKCTMQGHKVHT